MNAHQNGTAPEAPATQSTALAKHTGAIEPQNFPELKALATHAAGSNFYGAKTAEQALMLMMTGRDLGLSYTQALRMFHVIQGKPVLSADGMTAVCLQSPACEYFRVEGDNEKATAFTKRRGQPEQSCTFTMDDAKRAGLTGKDNWRMYPGRMLKARAKANLARDVYPELLAGLYDPDEMEPAPPQRVEVIAEPVIEYDPKAKDAFLDAIRLAGGMGELKATAKSISAAKAQGIISVGDAEEIRAAYEERSKELKAARQKVAPATPPSEPEVDEDAARAAAIDRGEA